MAFESVQFYFMVTAATAQTGAGKVYVSYQTNTPDAADYADMSSDWAPITEMYIPDEDPVPTEATDGEMNL
ncbi:MAG: hypothetical protein KBT12_06365 [Bacteroidales bacterium]|nr:hypothetical protein [Candidatus Physcousia equi]